jgi:uncharacterized protein YbjT (DUF2867 family)
MIMIAGGTGVLGSEIARRLLEQRRPVRVMTRDSRRANNLRAAGAEVVAADLRHVDSLRAACEGATHIITTANAFSGTGADSVAAVDVQGTRNLIDVARELAVRQFIFTSALLPREFAAVDYFAAKFDNEKYLRASGLPYTILRPTAFMETWAQMLADSIVTRGVAQIFGPGTTPINFVAVHDVAEIAAMTIDRPDATNSVVEIGGPETLTILDVVDTVERVTRRKAKRKHTPVWLMRALPPIIGPFHPVLARGMRAGALFATIPQPFDPATMLARFPIVPTRLEDWTRERFGSTVSM